MLCHLCLAVTRHVYYYLCHSCLYLSIKFLLLCHLGRVLDQFLLASLNIGVLFPILQIQLVWTGVLYHKLCFTSFGRFVGTDQHSICLGHCQLLWQKQVNEISYSQHHLPKSECFVTRKSHRSMNWLFS